jgi:tetratricopeptide (TPR) repeat protein/glycosyltransferase involved in cell wall biosynthesis
LKVKKKNSHNVNDEFPLAVKYYENGNVDAARITLEGMIRKNPKDYDALIFLGGIHLSAGNYQKSSEYYHKVVAMVDNHPTANYNLGLSYHRLNKLSEAEQCYKKTLQINPKNIDALNNLGVIYISLNKKVEALEYYNRAIGINKNNANTLNNLGNLFSSDGNFAEAEKNYKKAIQVDQFNPLYLFNLADCLLKQKKYDESIAELEKAIKLKPDYYQAFNSLGVANLKKGNINAAKELFEHAIKIKNDFWEAYQNLGTCFEKMNMHSEAISLYNKVLELNNGNFEAIIKISNLEMETGNYAESEAILKKLEENDQAKIIEYTNTGVAKLKQGKVDEAIELTKKALNESDDNALTHYNLAHALLLKGDFKRGWQEYEWRKKRDDFEKREFSKPGLKDQNIGGKKILVYDEQGLGDSIQFVRYIPMLKEKGAYVILECGQRLAGLFKNLNVADQLIIKNGTREPEVEYDYHIALLSLPLYFNTEIESIPNKTPYLFAEEKYKEKWEVIIPDNDKLNVGISWAGNPKNYNDKNRSCRLRDLEELFNTPNVKFYSLQKGDAVKQIYERGDDKVIDLDVMMDSMDTTAAAIERLDLVISVDTSIAHLSAAMGKPTWVMLPFLPDWRWMLEREDSPWYPSVRLFRQTQEKDWSGVINKISVELKKFYEEKFGHSTVSKDKSANVNNLQNDKKIFLALSKGENFGWGVCSKYLRKELANKIGVTNTDELPNAQSVEGDLLHALTDIDFNSITNLRGKRNFGYTFFENELTAKSAENAAKYDIVFGGSTWCKEKMEAKGIKNTGLLIQGIDPELFYPVENTRNDNLFIIFSGGKFELRKGQDLVIKAFEILHKKYLNMILINAWYNFWPQTMATMKHSSHIKFEMKGNTWQEFVSGILSMNGIDLNRVFTLPETPNDKLRELYSKSDIGIFPNRCEGGTNLVLMEYMACGKPVIASYNSGHKDVLTENNSIQLKEMKKFNLFAGQTMLADWEEASLDEIINAIEFAYHNNEKIKNIGKKAGEDMKNFTWEKTAESFLSQID